jgi:CHAD domain-containing protein
MPRSSKSAGKAASIAERTQRQRRDSGPQLNAMLPCDTAFRIVARRYLGDLTANHQATCRGNAVALHQMRRALTRLRTAISFFSPMVAGPARTRIRAELKWLNSHLGVVRDLDVAIERLKTIDKRRPQAIPHHRSWNAKRADSHRKLARALRSARFRRLVEDTSAWIAHGPWSIKKGKRAVRERACPIAAYSVRKLTRWQENLLKKSRKLLQMGTGRRHRLRLMNKKVCYSIEAFGDLPSGKKFSRQQAMLKSLRKAQRSLGQLNDDAKGQSLATAPERDGVAAPLPSLGRKREKRLIRRAAAAYRELR